MENKRTLMKGIGIFIVMIMVLQVIMPTAVYAMSITQMIENITTTALYKIKDDILSNVPTASTVETFLQNVSADSGAVCQIYSGNVAISTTDKVATGMTLKVGDSTEYTIIVRGDIKEDGEMTAVDLSILTQHTSNNIQLGGNRFKAGDINGDTKITAVDVSQAKMLIVGLAIPGDREVIDVSGEIRLSASTTNLAKSVVVTVTWPANSGEYTKQVSVDGGKSYTNNVNEVTVTKNGTVIARLKDDQGRTVKTASLTIGNVDSDGPEMFTFDVEHKITNYVTLKGETTDSQGPVTKYYFSRTNGEVWSPNAGLATGEYTFTQVDPNTTIKLRMKAADRVGNTTTTEAINLRTFKKGITILKEQLGTEVTIDEENETIELADGRIFRIAVTEEGTYVIRSIGTEADSQTQVEEENTLNAKIEQYQENGISTPKAILEELTKEGLGSGDVVENTFTTEKKDSYIIYRIIQNEDDSYSLVFSEKILKNNLSQSGQILEQETIRQFEALMNSMIVNGNVNISNLLDKAVEQGILVKENINKARGTFETEIGQVYGIAKNEEEGTWMTVLLGLAEEVENGLVAEELLKTLKDGIINQVIDWAIADGFTTAANANREDGTYKTASGQYKQVLVDLEKGTYETTDITAADATLKITLDPEFPMMTNNIQMTIEANDKYGIAELAVESESDQNFMVQTYDNRPLTATKTIEITNNGIYRVILTSSNGTTVEKEVIISNISTLLPIKYTIIPETARNTAKTEIQNGMATGPITVDIKFSEATLLENADKYQYRLGESGQWQVTARETTINDITENQNIYARYVDEEGNALKQVTIMIDNIDNVAPNAFQFTTVNTSNSISVVAETKDTAQDSAGNIAREGVEGIQYYEYKMGDGEWQKSDVFENLTQSTNYTISVKAVDHAGNETLATNNGATVTTPSVPKASEKVTFTYEPTTGDTKEAIKVKVVAPELENTAYKTQFQIVNDASELTETGWVTGTEYTTPVNCKIYVRIVDTTGQVAANDYKIATIDRIDNLPPQEFTPQLTARTTTSITLNASDKNNGKAVDAEPTTASKSTGIASYSYYLIPKTGTIKKVENVTEHTVTFNELTSGSAYSVYVEAKDAVGNVRMSETIIVATNAEVGKIAMATTTITGTKPTYNNPIIPAGFKAIDAGEAAWGDGTANPTGWNNGLVIEDEDKNQFVWVPVDGTTIKYQNNVLSGDTKGTDGDEPTKNGKELTVTDQINAYEGYYVARYETGKVGVVTVSKPEESPWTSINLATAKSRTETMYEDSQYVQAGVITGTQWDTMMSWIASTEGKDTVEKVNTAIGKYTGTEKALTASSENYKVKNLYDLFGNVQEMTNEINGNNVIVRGGAYDQSKSGLSRTSIRNGQTADNMGFRTVLYVIENPELELDDNDGILGYKINNGTEHRTVNGLEASYLNPVIPVGFQAVKAEGTNDAKWSGITPSGWNKGLVIRDPNGNEFVWVPVKTIEDYTKWYTIYAPESLEESYIKGDTLPDALKTLNEEEKTQIEKYGGFYIARYEAGNVDSKLSSISGAKPVSAVTFAQAKEYAESMYTTTYVKSGLLTGTMWDTTVKWIASTSTNSKVMNDWESGNNYANSFTFTGDYAVGPNNTTEIRGDYTYGENITKPANTRYLLSTGIVEDFKMNNIYDLAGNVWEYTSEYCENEAGEIEYIARGADYYRTYPVAGGNWGAAMRENISNPPGEIRNEGGFRVALFLTEGTAEIGKFAKGNSKIFSNGNQKESQVGYSNPVIPAGYAAVNTGANWGDGTTIRPDYENGLVIEDQAGNEFVWVPVKTLEDYEKWAARPGISYKNTDGDDIPAVVTEEWGEKEKTQIIKWGGFYISRYEASLSDDGKIQSQAAGNSIPANISYADAKAKAESLETKEEVASGLVTGTQWDTTMNWIASDLGEEAVVENSSSWGNYENTNLATKKVKNIYNLAGGSWEISAEKTGDSTVLRGGYYQDTSGTGTARAEYGEAVKDGATSFRMVLYVTGSVEDIATKPVGESEKLAGTEFPGAVNEPVLKEGMTPMKWTGSSWTATTADDTEWYNYGNVVENGENTSKWANARTPDGSMWVWIPRYAYKINYSNPDSVKAGGTIDVIFLKDNTNDPLRPNENTIYAKADSTHTTSNSYIVHPAFRGDTTIGGWDKELSGIWVAKFEASGEYKTIQVPIKDAYGDIIRYETQLIDTVASKPGLTSFAYDRQGSGHYNMARSASFGMTKEQKASVDTHMAKNSEWAAVSYLAHSVYGRNGVRPSSVISGTTGNSWQSNPLQSTTGNVYGIYDMVGGRPEYTASYTANIADARYQNIAAIVNAPARYKQKYTSKDGYYGDAYQETAGWQGGAAQNLYDYSSRWKDRHNIGDARPLFVRGATGYGASTGGTYTLFHITLQCGNGNFAYSYRTVMITE